MVECLLKSYVILCCNPVVVTFSLADIYILDKLGLIFQALPNRTLHLAELAKY